MPTLGLVCSAADGIEHVTEQVIQPFVDAGWTVAVTLTPTAECWLEATGDIARIAQATGHVVRSQPRLPSEPSPHPPVDGYAVVPASANTVAKLALGIADNQALTQVCEAIGGRLPVVIFPCINASHAGQPAWDDHITALNRAGVHLVYGDHVWPLPQPRSEPAKQPPWSSIRCTIEHVIGQCPVNPSTRARGTTC